MEKNIARLLQNQKSRERIMEIKFHDLDIKVIELSSMVNALNQEVYVVPLPRSDDDDIPTLPMTAQFRTEARSVAEAAIETRPSVSAPTATSIMPPSAPPKSAPLA
ncbi:hypothetical protein D1007_43538 [Hordeum vulgare]|nr:hypothetical protein D1007_43538 [Hordeum vulgare]